MDTDRSGVAVRRMWRKLALRLEAAAYEAAESRRVSDAIYCAMLAECAFWQATGEDDSATFTTALKYRSEMAS